MIQGTIFGKKKKKATLFKCGFQHVWFHTNYRTYCTPDNHHCNLTLPSNFKFLLQTNNFLPLSESASADLCCSCIFDLSSGAQQRRKYHSCSSFYFFSFFLFFFFQGVLPILRVHVTPILTKSTVTSHQSQRRNWTYITVPPASTAELWGH